MKDFCEVKQIKSGEWFETADGLIWVYNETRMFTEIVKPFASTPENRFICSKCQKEFTAFLSLRISHKYPGPLCTGCAYQLVHEFGLEKDSIHIKD